jgi:hypothetical protein
MSVREQRAPQTFGTIIVVGGGCYGGYYVRQLGRAARAGAVRADRVVVVDRDPNCAVARTLDDVSPMSVDLVVRDWREFFNEYLSDAAARPSVTASDAIVPSPLMPHLMAGWLVERARERFRERVSTAAFDSVPDVPWERAGGDGTHYVSFATWMCPVNCVEPRICPHTREARDWSMPERVATYAAARQSGTESAVLFCRHRAYGVGMFDTAEVLEADRRIQTAGARGAADVVIGTVSHCHGALTRLVIGPKEWFTFEALHQVPEDR